MAAKLLRASHLRLNISIFKNWAPNPLPFFFAFSFFTLIPFNAFSLKYLFLSTLSSGSKIELTGILSFFCKTGFGSVGYLSRSFRIPMIITRRLFCGTSKSLAYNLHIIRTFY